MKKYLSYFLVCALVCAQLLAFNTGVKANTLNEKDRIPKIQSVKQISPNEIEISYDMDVDPDLGVKATNYWVQDNKNVIPGGIATLGKNDKVNEGNSLTNDTVTITPKNGSNKEFVLKFSKDIPSGEEYKLIVCYVTVKGAKPYTGDNGAVVFVGK